MPLSEPVPCCGAVDLLARRLEALTDQMAAQNQLLMQLIALNQDLLADVMAEADEAEGAGAYLDGSTL